MADTRLTKINFFHKTYLFLVGILKPEKFIEEQEKDEEKRKNFPQPVPPREHKIWIVRRAFWSSLFLVIFSVIFGCILGFISNRLFGCVQKKVVNIMQIIGALLLLWATLFVRGWSIQTYGGVTLAERLNKWIFRSLYSIATVIIVWSLVLQICNRR
jgi:hypothetical protein